MKTVLFVLVCLLPRLSALTINQTLSFAASGTGNETARDSSVCVFGPLDLNGANSVECAVSFSFTATSSERNPFSTPILHQPFVAMDAVHLHFISGGVAFFTERVALSQTVLFGGDPVVLQPGASHTTQSLFSGQFTHTFTSNFDWMSEPDARLVIQATAFGGNSYLGVSFNGFAETTIAAASHNTPDTGEGVLAIALLVGLHGAVHRRKIRGQ